MERVSPGTDGVPGEYGRRSSPSQQRALARILSRELSARREASLSKVGQKEVAGQPGQLPQRDRQPAGGGQQECNAEWKRLPAGLRQDRCLPKAARISLGEGQRGPGARHDGQPAAEVRLSEARKMDLRARLLLGGRPRKGPSGTGDRGAPRQRC